MSSDCCSRLLWLGLFHTRKCLFSTSSDVMINRIFLWLLLWSQCSMQTFVLIFFLRLIPGSFQLLRRCTTVFPPILVVWKSGISSYVLRKVLRVLHLIEVIRVPIVDIDRLYGLYIGLIFPGSWASFQSISISCFMSL